MKFNINNFQEEGEEEEEEEVKEVQPVPLLMWNENRKSIFCIYSNSNLTVTKTYSSGISNCCVIGNVAVDKFTVRIDLQYGGLTIGFTTRDHWDPNRDNTNNYMDGFFLYMDI